MNTCHAFYTRLKAEQKSDYVQMLAKLTELPRQELLSDLDPLWTWQRWSAFDPFAPEEAEKVLLPLQI